MNRCIENASGDYLCIWNVDDLRTPDSIEVMAKALDDNPDVNFVYGNYYIVPSFGSTNGQYVDETGKEEYLKVGMILGPFFMFRKSALKKSGVFDEQLMSGADYDLALRLAFNGKGLHIPLNLGYYLNDGQGLSTGSRKQPIERTVVELRYGVRVLEPHLVPETREYDVENIIINDKKIPAKSFK
jgi:GT2 family glycosyltransferase